MNEQIEDLKHSIDNVMFELSEIHQTVTAQQNLIVSLLRQTVGDANSQRILLEYYDGLIHDASLIGNQPSLYYFPQKLPSRIFDLKDKLRLSRMVYEELPPSAD